MADKIRLGIIGANIHRGWAIRSHLPAVVASPDFELTGVCTTRMDSAEESREKFGARLAFDDYNKMLAHPEIDAVVVSLRVPNHYEPTMAVLDAGKHVYTEWPLGRTTAEAEEMTAKAHEKGVCNIVGLQAHGNPAVLYLRDLVASGYVGDVMASHVHRIGSGILERESDRSWQGDKELGANTLTINSGHTIEAMLVILGDFSHVSTVVSTQARQWFETDTKQMVDVTAPDNVLINGKLAGGGVASVHIANNPWAGSGFRMEIYGSAGTLTATSSESPNQDGVRLQGAQGGNRLQDLEIPAGYVDVPEEMPRGAPYNVGQMHRRFAEGIRNGKGATPDFAAAVRLHRFIDQIQQASDSGREVAAG